MSSKGALFEQFKQESMSFQPMNLMLNEGSSLCFFLMTRLHCRPPIHEQWDGCHNSEMKNYKIFIKKSTCTFSKTSYIFSSLHEVNVNYKYLNSSEKGWCTNTHNQKVWTLLASQDLCPHCRHNNFYFLTICYLWRRFETCVFMTERTCFKRINEKREHLISAFPIIQSRILLFFVDTINKML